jgi:hypothetical protein
MLKLAYSVIYNVQVGFLPAVVAVKKRSMNIYNFELKSSKVSWIVKNKLGP